MDNGHHDGKSSDESPSCTKLFRSVPILFHAQIPKILLDVASAYLHTSIPFVNGDNHIIHDRIYEALSLELLVKNSIVARERGLAFLFQVDSDECTLP